MFVHLRSDLAADVEDARLHLIYLDKSQEDNLICIGNYFNYVE
jgi:hypothetical protein